MIADDIDNLVKRADPVGPTPLVGPDSPEAEGIWERVLAATSPGAGVPPPPRPRSGQARRLTLPALGVGVVAAVVILVLQLLPTPVLPASSASAAVLRHLAERAAAVEPAAMLNGDQWLQSEFRVSYLAAPSHEGPESAALQAARAVVEVDAEVWANDLSQYCVRQVVTSVAYNSPASRQAWLSSGIGLPSTPQPECGSGSLRADGQGIGTLDVARLPTDPVALAKALETGTTGIAALDKPPRSLTPFGRAVMLLVGPTLGATPALWSALLRAMATMPGVAFLGAETTHSGATGVALAGAAGQGHRTTIILSPSTGALLEARKPVVFQLLATLPTTGVVAIQWLDAAGIPQVVDSGMLPSSLAGQVPTGIVSAVTKPGVPLSRWDAWLRSVLPELPGNSSAGAGITGTPGVYSVSVITHAPDPDLALIMRLFRGSGLVHGIRSALG